MWMFLRHLFAIAALPGLVAVVVPLWLARENHVALTAPADVTTAAWQVAGAGLLAIGLVLFSTSLYYFASRGRGTLAPWDPPRRFVVDGPYRFVRNPMISGVIFILLGEAAVLRSLPHAVWAGLVILINALYIPALEEPMLAERFGESYQQYKRGVRRFVPRLSPWDPDARRLERQRPV
jgi:protein-S-isoprenylcysteine O-methyltransferase Ste14